ncbi:hypothetical protein NDU88_000151, partial [Pleurodeles waltl]
AGDGLGHKPSPYQVPPGAGDRLGHKPSPHQEPPGAGDGLGHKPSPHQEPPGAGDGFWCGRLGASATNRALIRSPQEQEKDSGVDGWRSQPQAEPTSGAPRSRCRTQPQTEPTSVPPKNSRRTLVWMAGGLSHKPSPHQEPPGDGLWCGRLVASATNRAHIRSPQEQEVDSGVDGWWPQPQTEPTSGVPQPQTEPTSGAPRSRRRTQTQTEPTSGAPRSRRRALVWTARASATNGAHIRSPSATNRAHIRSPRSPQEQETASGVDGWWPQPQTEPTSGAPRSRIRTQVWTAGSLSRKPSPHQEPLGAGDGLRCGRLVASATNRGNIRSPSATNGAHIRSPQEQETDSATSRAHIRSPQEQETDSGVDGWWPQPQTKPTSGAPRSRRRTLVWTAGGLSHKLSPHQEPVGAGDGLSHKPSIHQEPPGAADRLWCGRLGASATNRAHIRSP